MRVAFVTLYDPRDPEAFNGSGYWARRSMQQHGLELDYLVPAGCPNGYAVAVKSRLYKLVLHQWYTHNRDTRRVRGYGREIAERLKGLPAMWSSAPTVRARSPLRTSSALSRLSSGPTRPSPRSFKGGTEAKLSRESRRHGLRNEAAALSRASLLLYLSDWAARSAIEHYGVSPDKVHVLPPARIWRFTTVRQMCSR